MYEEYMQNFFNCPMNGYRNTYEQMEDFYPYNYNNDDMFWDNFNPYNIQNRNNMQMANLDDYYPEIYKVVYPMVKKACTRNNRGINKETIDNMVDEIYRNIEADGIELNITINNDVRSDNATQNTGNEENRKENRETRRNSILNDLIRILILRELIGRPGCIGSNCNPRPRPPRPNPGMRPPFPRYDFGEF